MENGSVIRRIWSVTNFMYGHNFSCFWSIWIYSFSNTIIENGCENGLLYVYLVDNMDRDIIGVITVFIV